MRAFVALEIPDPAVLDRIVSVQKEIFATGADVKLVERENLHYTVKFLGEISQAQAAEASSRLNGLKLNSVEIDVQGIGVFPSSSRPRIIWVGAAEEDAAKVSALAGEVIKSLQGLGESDSRPFRPHLTIARVRSARNVRELSAAVARSGNMVFGRVKLAALKLKSSVLTPKGPVYSDVGVYPLL